MQDMKSRWQSRGFVGPIVAAVCLLASTAGIEDLPALFGVSGAEGLTDLVVKVVGIASAIIGSYGRLKATHFLK